MNDGVEERIRLAVQLAQLKSMQEEVARRVGRIEEMYATRAALAVVNEKTSENQRWITWALRGLIGAAAALAYYLYELQA